MIMDNIDILEGMDETKRAQLFDLAGVMADPLTRRILAKLSSKGSPISVDSVPTDKLQGKRSNVITRLVTLEKKGFVKSSKVTSQNGFCKKYFINEKAIPLVEQLMKPESKLYPQ